MSNRYAKINFRAGFCLINLNFVATNRANKSSTLLVICE